MHHTTKNSQRTHHDEYARDSHAGSFLLRWFGRAGTEGEELSWHKSSARQPWSTLFGVIPVIAHVRLLISPSWPVREANCHSLIGAQWSTHPPKSRVCGPPQCRH